MNDEYEEKIKVGDKVTHIDGTWPSPATIRKIDRDGTDVVAYLEEGGYWRLFKLRKVL